MLPAALSIAILLGQGVPPPARAEGRGAVILQHLADEGVALTAGPVDGDAVTLEARRAVVPAGPDGAPSRPGGEVTLSGAYRVQGGALTILRAVPRAVTASSALAPSKEGDHLALRAADDRTDTAWCEGAEGAGGGQWIRLQFDEPLPLTGITILPGDAASPSRFEERARPRRIRVFAPPRAPVEVELLDRPEPQRVALSRGVEVRAVEVRIIRVWRGTERPDLCISDLYADGR